jgi:hypothetical protein
MKQIWCSVCTMGFEVWSSLPTKKMHSLPLATVIFLRFYMNRVLIYRKLNTLYHLKYLKQEIKSKSSVSSESALSFVWNFWSTFNCSVSKSCELVSKTSLCSEKRNNLRYLIEKRHEAQSKREKIHWGFEKYLMYLQKFWFLSQVFWF